MNSEMLESCTLKLFYSVITLGQSSLFHRLLEEEAERRRELEKLKEEQEKQLAEETERRKGLEQQSEELARIQKEQAEALQKEQERLQKLSEERKAADAQLQVIFWAILFKTHAPL